MDKELGQAILAYYRASMLAGENIGYATIQDTDLDHCVLDLSRTTPDKIRAVLEHQFHLDTTLEATEHEHNYKVTCAILGDRAQTLSDIQQATEQMRDKAVEEYADKNIQHYAAPLEQQANMIGNHDPARYEEFRQKLHTAMMRHYDATLTPPVATIHRGDAKREDELCEGKGFESP